MSQDADAGASSMFAQQTNRTEALRRMIDNEVREAPEMATLEQLKQLIASRQQASLQMDYKIDGPIRQLVDQAVARKLEGEIGRVHGQLKEASHTFRADHAMALERGRPTADFGRCGK